MPVDRQARTNLRSAIVAYMRGAIRSFALEDQYSPCRTSPDEAVQDIAQQLWCIHDELVDHSISVQPEGWERLRRTVAFLGTDLEIAPLDSPSWPFRNDGQWHMNEHLVDGLDLPDYDPDIHGRPGNPWWNRVSTSTGVLILVALLVAVFLVIAFL